MNEAPVLLEYEGLDGKTVVVAAETEPGHAPTDE